MVRFLACLLLFVFGLGWLRGRVSDFNTNETVRKGSEDSAVYEGPIHLKLKVAETRR